MTHLSAVELPRCDAVRGIRFDGSIPGCRHQYTLWGAENFQAVVGSAEKHIKVEFHVSQIDLKLGSLFAPRRKVHAAIARNPRLPEAQFAFLADVTVHQIGRASCRERVCHYVKITVVAVTLNKK